MGLHHATEEQRCPTYPRGCTPSVVLSTVGKTLERRHSLSPWATFNLSRREGLEFGEIGRFSELLARQRVVHWEVGTVEALQRRAASRPDVSRGCKGFVQPKPLGHELPWAPEGGSRVHGALESRWGRVYGSLLLYGHVHVPWGLGGPQTGSQTGANGRSDLALANGRKLDSQPTRTVR